MFKNYVKIAYRNLLRHKGYTAINVVGLALGIACCVLIFLYVRNELAVDASIADVERVYRLDSDWREESMGLKIVTAAAAAPTMVAQYPDVEAGVRIYLMTNRIRVGETALRRDVMMADPNVLTFFGLPMVAGDPATALLEPRSVVITDELAQTLFGTTDVLGRPILIETWRQGEQPFTITGVRQSLPFNTATHFRVDNGEYDVIVGPEPFGDFFDESGWTSWSSRYILQYVKLAPEVDVRALRAKLAGFVEAHAPPELHGDLEIELNPLRTLYLTDEDGRGWQAIAVLSAVALLVLLIACINFVNLSTARSLTRAKEVGVRKTVGAVRRQLVGQFLSESALVALAATALGATIAALCFDAFFHLADKHVVLPQPWDVRTVGALFAVALVTGGLAGLYPAFALSSFRPTQALKGTLRLGGVGVRKGLVVTQFALAVVLLVGVLTVSRQMDFISSKDLGFDRENVLIISSVPRNFDEEGLAEIETAKERLTAMPDVRAASLAWDTPGGRGMVGGDTRAVHPPEQSRERAFSVAFAIVDADFPETYGLALKEGCFFSDGRPADHAGVVLNESAVRALGWEGDVEGKRLVVWQTTRPALDADPPPAQPVIGVVEDHHFTSLHEPIRPMAFFSVKADTMWRVMALRLAAGADVRQTVVRVERTWKEALPHAPFEYAFLDDQIEETYRTEEQLRQVAGLAAGLAIAIACLGMLGLAALSAQRRTKEIGVRKVLGASAGQIVLLLSREVTRPVLLAIVIATPVAYLLLRQWLDGFAYRTALSWETFAMAGVAALVVAWLTVGYHALRAATADPVESLRYE